MGRRHRPALIHRRGARYQVRGLILRENPSSVAFLASNLLFGFKMVRWRALTTPLPYRLGAVSLHRCTQVATPTIPMFSYRFVAVYNSADDYACQAIDVLEKLLIMCYAGVPPPDAAGTSRRAKSKALTTQQQALVSEIKKVRFLRRRRCGCA